jgi:ATP-dependent helicase/DNAse subunit B
LPATDSRGRAPGPRELARQAEINASRRQVVDVLGAFLESSNGILPAHEWAERLRQLFDRAKVADRITAWTQSAESEGAVEQAAQHQQARDAVNAFIDDLGKTRSPICRSPRPTRCKSSKRAWRN